MRPIVLLDGPRDDAGEIATKAPAFVAAPTEQPPRKLSGKRTVSSGRSGERRHDINVVTSTEGDSPRLTLRGLRRIKLSGNRDRWGAANGFRAGGQPSL